MRVRQRSCVQRRRKRANALTSERELELGRETKITKRGMEGRGGGKWAERASWSICGKRARGGLAQTFQSEINQYKGVSHRLKKEQFAAEKTKRSQAVKRSS
eukprot:1818365-Pleurochrysis_carterae.AAC.1